VFVNPALTEPFGLTLLEAAASGLPVVTTDDGGPRDIVRHCRNGLLVDVSRPDALRLALERSLVDSVRWRQWSRNGLEAVGKFYCWQAHGATYLKEARAVILGKREGRGAPLPTLPRCGTAPPSQLGGTSPLPLGWCAFEAGIQ
jgi:sucrose-phosphate synthase